MKSHHNELKTLLAKLEAELAAAPSIAAESRASLQRIVNQLRQSIAAEEAPPAGNAEQPHHGLADFASRFAADHPDVAAALRAVADSLAKAGI